MARAFGVVISAICCNAGIFVFILHFGWALTRSLASRSFVFLLLQRAFLSSQFIIARFETLILILVTVMSHALPEACEEVCFSVQSACWRLFQTLDVSPRIRQPWAIRLQFSFICYSASSHCLPPCAFSNSRKTKLAPQLVWQKCHRLQCFLMLHFVLHFACLLCLILILHFACMQCRVPFATACCYCVNCVAHHCTGSRSRKTKLTPHVWQKWHHLLNAAFVVIRYLQ